MSRAQFDAIERLQQKVIKLEIELQELSEQVRINNFAALIVFGLVAYEIWEWLSS